MKDGLTQLLTVASQFCSLVCDSLRSLPAAERVALLGNYLFCIGLEARFVVMIENEEVTSCFSRENQDGTENKLLYRAVILTDAKTLNRLLAKTLKAHVAFMTKRVVVEGDLAAFLKMVSLLKRENIKP